jgi:predicted nucleic acid-binding protein
VRLVIADTGPISYLVLIGHVDILPLLFDKVVLPKVVEHELTHPATPVLVRNWIAVPPPWMEIRSIGGTVEETLQGLDAGEEAAILLALEIHADLLLIDDREGVAAARRRGLKVAGTLGVLGMGASRGLLNLAEAFDRLKQTNFYYRQEMLDQLLKQFESRKP